MNLTGEKKGGTLTHRSPVDSRCTNVHCRPAPARLGRAVPLLAICWMLGACYTGLEGTQKLHPSFDLPEGWTIIDERPGYVALVADHG